ncbi:MAG: GldG family protein [Burkholderiales bacterium]|nr:GldG family protein [Burkholderiales bacterium]
MNKTQSLLYSAVGLVALFLLLVAANFLASRAAVRADLTEGRIYTLSEGTRKILGKLDGPVKVRLYISKGDAAMPVQLKSFAQRVEDLLREFKAEAGANLVIEKYNPKPDSDEEDAAQLDGVEPQTLNTGEQFYLGLTVSRLDRKEAIAGVNPQRERLLEYDLIRAIARVASSERPVIGVMSAVPVMGAPFNMMTRQPTEPWVLAGELKRDFEVKNIPITAETIDPAIKTLLLIHPRDIMERTEYALDQFVLRGGKLIAFVDPHMYFDQQPNPMMPMAQGQPGQSNLPRLFKAWGVNMELGKVLADVTYASGQGQRTTPTILTLNRTAMNRDDIATGQIETLLLAFSGAFDIKPAAGLTVTELMRSSPNNMFVDSIVASLSGDTATKGFVPTNKSLPLAVRLTGKFKTAFPEGQPEPLGKKDEAKDAKKAEAPPQLKEAAAENAVVLVADADMLADGAAVEVQNIFGQRVVIPSNGNLAFAQGLLEQAAAGDDLSTLRTRTSIFRPLTVVREMESNAQKQYFGKIKSMEDDLQQTTEKMQKLQRPGGDAKSAQILTPEQQAELERFRKRVLQTRRELKDLRKDLRQDAEALQFWTKVVNIAAVPTLVALFGIGMAVARQRRATARPAPPAPAAAGA